MYDKLQILEHNLQMPVVDINSDKNRSKNLSECVKRFSSSNEFGLLLRVDDRQNPVFKIASLILVALSLKLLTLRLRKMGLGSVTSYGVYPCVEDPVTIFELRSEAEQYIHQNVLPKFPYGLNGRIRRCIMILTRLHPSLAGVVVTARKLQ